MMYLIAFLISCTIITGVKLIQWGSVLSGVIGQEATPINVDLLMTIKKQSELVWWVFLPSTIAWPLLLVGQLT